MPEQRPGHRALEAGVIGVPFRLVTDFPRGTCAVCRIVPPPDRDRLTRPLPDACRR